jgi:circadian clock protein KaiC
MPERDFVKTGIAGLDSLLSGGVPRGNVILLEGSIGTGKTTLGTEFIYRGAHEFGEPGVIVLFEVSPDKLVRDAANFGWDLRRLERDRRLKIVFTTRQVFRQEIQQADSLLLAEAASINARRIFVDGASRLSDGTGIQENREAFHILVEGLQRENLTAALVVEAAVLHDGGPPVHEESIADTVLRLRMEDVDRATQRSLEIVKSRGHDFQMGRHSFRIIDGQGIQVYRRVQAPRRDSRENSDPVGHDSDRITTGVPGFDALVNGGFYRASTTVLAGISGVGKSVFGLQYMAEGLRRKQRALMLTLDERVPQVMRNAKSIGIDFAPGIDSGQLELYYDAPQEIDVDQHFFKIENIIQRLRPERMVLDSLSTYGSTLGTSGRLFRDFFHALVALMKEYQVTAIYNHENPELLGMSSMMGTFHMSSLVDNIVLLNWIELGDTFRLGLTVAKTRASPVSRTTHECEIRDGEGMRVLPREISPAALQASFSRYYGLIARTPTRVQDERPPRINDRGTKRSPNRPPREDGA